MKRKDFMTKAAVFVLAASMLSGCGSADEEKNTGKRKTMESVFESDETDEPDDSFELSYEDIEGFISDGEMKTEVPGGYSGIYSTEDLKNVKNDGKYILMADLDLSDISDCLIGKFEGILDGNYHVISGSKCSLINRLIGTVKNLAFENVDAQSAVLADNMGYMGSGSIENCYVTGTITDGSGGLINEIIVTNNDVSIINCYNKSNITSDDYYHVKAVGGIVGRISFNEAYGKPDIMIDNCWNYGEIENKSADECAGGIIGDIVNNSGGDGYYSNSNLNATVQRCFNYGKINSSDAAGGIIGSISVTNASDSNNNIYTIQQCANYGTVTAKKSAGGISGEVYTRVNTGCERLLHVDFSDCLNTGNIRYGEEGSLNDGGGVIGTNKGFNYSGGYVSVAYCLNIGDYSDACNKSDSVGDGLFSCGEYYTRGDLSIAEMKDMEKNLPEFDKDIWGISDDFSGFPHPYGSLESEKIYEFRNKKQQEKEAEQVEEILEDNNTYELIQNQKYTDVLACIEFTGRWPEADPSINYLRDSTNRFDISDINNDGKEELIIQTSQGYMSYTYEEGNDKATQTVFYEGKEESVAFFEEYPALNNCDWKDIKYENYSAYTKAYMEHYISIMSKELDEKADIGLAYAKNDDLDEIISYLESDFGFSFTSEEPEIYKKGSLNGKESVEISFDNGGSICYENEAIEGITMLGLKPGMSLDEAKEKLDGYGFFVDSEDSGERFYYLYITGDGFGNLRIYLKGENGIVNSITLLWGSAYAG